MKRYSKSQLAKAYLTLTREGSRPRAIKALAVALVTARLTHEVDVVVREISRQLLAEDVLLAEVVSAHNLSRERKSAIEARLSQFSAAKQLSAMYTQDENLIGGFIAKLPTHEIDASVASMIRKISLPVSS